MGVKFNIAAERVAAGPSPVVRHREVSGPKVALVAARSDTFLVSYQSTTENVPMRRQYVAIVPEFVFSARGWLQPERKGMAADKLSRQGGDDLRHESWFIPM